MNFKRELRGDWRVLALISVGLFVFLWSRHIPAYAKGDGVSRNWSLWVTFFRHDYICSTGEMLGGLLGTNLLFGVPSLLAGWLGQYFVVFVWGKLFPSSQHEPT